MSTARFMLKLFSVASVAGAGTALLYGATKWKTGTNTQTGIINNTGKKGLFIKTYEMDVQRSEVSNGNPRNNMDMSLYGDQELIKKAQQYCEEGTFVKIKYDRFFLLNPFKASSPRMVTDIEAVTKTPGFEIKTKK
ncbi:MAG TPA: hypothetical protein VJN02_12505 [Gammaproteobacteria bacterium]|nr:hypothetical protein [Gammaproteobacteria bacterium]